MDKLRTALSTLISQGAVIAFSGGVDSSLLLKLACEQGNLLGKPVYAVTFNTRLHPKADAKIARDFALSVGAQYYVIDIDELQHPSIINNPTDRCYHCKHYLFSTLRDFAAEHNLRHIIDGTNHDDLSEYRPGLKALSELCIHSPLAELGIGKDRVREMAAQLGLKVSKRPSAPCLATRIPYNTPLDFDTLARLEQGEIVLSNLGFAVNRIRLHGDIARIEVLPDKLPELLGMKQQVISQLKSLGFLYITIDLEGFRSGSMDIKIKGNKNGLEKTS